jgi:hypothetical protein
LILLLRNASLLLLGSEASVYIGGDLKLADIETSVRNMKMSSPGKPPVSVLFVCLGNICPLPRDPFLSIIHPLNFHL